MASMVFVGGGQGRAVKGVGRLAATEFEILSGFPCQGVAINV